MRWSSYTWDGIAHSPHLYRQRCATMPQCYFTTHARRKGGDSPPGCDALPLNAYYFDQRVHMAPPSSAGYARNRARAHASHGRGQRRRREYPRPHLRGDTGMSGPRGFLFRLGALLTSQGEGRRRMQLSGRVHLALAPRVTPKGLLSRALKLAKRGLHHAAIPWPGPALARGAGARMHACASAQVRDAQSTCTARARARGGNCSPELCQPLLAPLRHVCLRRLALFALASLALLAAARVSCRRVSTLRGLSRTSCRCLVLRARELDSLTAGAHEPIIVTTRAPVGWTRVCCHCCHH